MADVTPSYRTGSIVSGAPSVIGAGSSFTVTAPVGLASGDVIFVHLAASYGSALSPTLTISGFTGSNTLAATGGGQYLQSWLFYKVAGGSEPATYTVNVTVNSFNGVWETSAFTGSTSTPVISISNNATTSNTSIPCGTVATPTVSSCALLLFGAYGSTAPGVSTFAVANNNPTWTKIYDTVLGSINYPLTLGAAPYPLLTSPGVGTITASPTGGNVVSVGFGVTLRGGDSETLFSSAYSVLAPTIPFVASIITIASAVLTPVITALTSKWTRQSKSSAPTWTNPTKS